MQTRSRQHIIIIVILILACIGAVRIERAKGNITSEINLNRIPLKLGEWVGKDIKVDKDVIEILGTSDVIVRQYKDPSGIIMNLSIVYSGSDRQSFHPPELCYVGGGIELIGKEADSTTLSDGKELKLTKLVMTSPAGEIRAWYWFLVGERFVGNFYKQQVYFLLDALRGKKLQGALIRISVRGETKDIGTKAKSFIKELSPYLTKTF